MFQTILGAGGPVARQLTQELKNYPGSIRLVSRNPKTIAGDEELLPLDLSNPQNIEQAVKGSVTVYITIGFPYFAKQWEKLWPPFMKATIAACVKHNAQLVFFDNIYMYDCSKLSGMTEETPMKPCSKKGAVRKQLVEMLLRARDEQGLKMLIARCADYYGPNIDRNGILDEMVVSKLAKGKSAQWLGVLNLPHSFTYVPDAAKAVALLGNDSSAYGQIWHLPTAHHPPTAQEWAQGFADEFKTPAKIKALPGWLLKIAGVFVPILRELHEMRYQYTQTYVFNSQKFENKYNFSPTPYNEGIKVTAKSYQNA